MEFYLPLHHKIDTVGQGESKGDLLFDQKDGHALVVQLLNNLEQPGNKEGHQACGGLIQQEDVRFFYERPRNGQGLLLPAAEGSCQLPQSLPEHRKQAENAFKLSGILLVPHAGLEVFENSHLRKELSPLGGIPDAPPGNLEGRKPGDAGYTTIITERTFMNREPEYEVHFRMPAKDKIGYFGEELKKVKAGVIREFLEKWEKIPKKRPGTSLIDGNFMYAKILREHDEKLKNLIFFSDMRQCAQGINEESIVRNGDQVVARLKADGLIPNMKGIDVWCMGVSPNGLNVFQYQKIENFWRTFFAAAQANLRCYDFGRSRSID